MSHEYGNVIWVEDPFKDEVGAERPFVIISSPGTPFHGQQYICLSLTSKTWHDDSIPLSAEDWTAGQPAVKSSIMPWSVMTIPADDISRQTGQLARAVVTAAVETLSGYLSPE